MSDLPMLVIAIGLILLSLLDFYSPVKATQKEEAEAEAEASATIIAINPENVQITYVGAR